MRNTSPKGGSMEKISVIVPIYKVEDFLNQSIESIRMQSYTNLEIILVDDGSPDSCPSICDDFAKKDPRIQVIHIENGGLSHARNIGLSRATGEYVAFVDSDDWIAPGFIQSMLEACKQEQCEMAICDYRKVDQEGNPIDHKNHENHKQYHKQNYNQNHTQKHNQIYEDNELLLSMYEDFHEKSTCFVVTWNKLYHRNLWNEIEFPKGRIHEDEATTYLLLDKAKKAVFVEEALYFYRQSPGSIMQKAFDHRRLDWIKALEERIIYFIKKDNKQLVTASMKAYADASITFYFRFKKEVPNSKTKRKQLKRNVHNIVRVVREFGRLSMRTRLGYYIFLLSPFLFHKIVGEA